LRINIEKNIIVWASLLPTLTRGSTLVTNNEKHFKRIKGLKIENWAGK
jgi:hypothetical protein